MRSLSIVLTGASGFIGSKTSQCLADKFPSCSIIGVGRKKALSRQISNPNFEYISCDLVKDKIRDCLPGKTDILIHLAGDRRTFVRPEEYSAQFRSNVEITTRMADYASTAGIKLILYASTVYVYSGNSEVPFKEAFISLPRDNLGATKMASESLLNARAVAGQFRSLSFRIGTVYGPGSSEEQFIPQSIIKLCSPDPVAKFGAGDVKRDFVYIDDAARAFVAGVERLYDRDFAYDALNVGTNRATSIREVVQILAGDIGINKQIEFGTFNNIGSEADTDHQLDITRIRSILGWKPEVSLREGLHRTIEAFQ